MLLTGLLAAQPHSYSAMLAAQASPAAPRHVVRAQDYIRAHRRPADHRRRARGRRRRRRAHALRGLPPVPWDDAHGVPEGDAARARARAELEAAPPETGVTAIALKWGFVHLGRFAQDYRRRYGELPSETLRR